MRFTWRWDDPPNLAGVWRAVIPDLDLTLLRSFLAVMETGSFTQAGRRVGRSQPAITHQMRRLETALGCSLIGFDGRRAVPTREGEDLLSHARALLRLNDDARARFSAPQVAGPVVLGMPDLYAAHLLPAILASFARTYPRIETELHCMRSVHLHAALHRGELDVAVLTNQPEFGGEGVVVRRERLVWVAAPEVRVEATEVLPLAVLPAGSVYRRVTLEALSAVRRQWRIASVSGSIAGLQAAVCAGLAVAVFPLCAVGQNLRLPGAAGGLPDLPSLELVLAKRSSGMSAAAERLADHIAAELAGVSAAGSG